MNYSNEGFLQFIFLLLIQCRFYVLIFLISADKSERKWKNQALVQSCWWALVLKVFLSKIPFNLFPESSTCLQTETWWNHSVPGWKGLQGSPGPALFGKSTHPVRQNLSVQHWGIQHFPGICQGLVVLTVKSAFSRASTIAVADFCSSKGLFHTERGCFLLFSPACSTALYISALLQLQTWRAGQGRKGRQIHSSAFLSS